MIVGELFDCLYVILTHNKLIFVWNLEIRWMMMTWERRNLKLNWNFEIVVKWCNKLILFENDYFVIVRGELTCFLFSKVLNYLWIEKIKCKKIILLESNWWWMVSRIVVWSCSVCVLNVLKLFLVILMMFLLLAKWKFKCLNLIFRNGFDRWWWALMTWFWLFY